MIKSINKLMKLTIAITTILSVSSVGANAEWRQNSTGWWYHEMHNALIHGQLVGERLTIDGITLEKMAI